MTNNIPGYMTEIECDTLKNIFTSSKKVIGVEIGSLHGRSSYEIAKAIPQGKLYCIDKWSNFDSSSAPGPNHPEPGTLCTLQFFKENVKDCDNIIPIQGSSPDIVQDWDEEVDFVFLDALHTNPSDWNNIEFWLPKIKKGGILSGHDFYSDRSDWVDVYNNVCRLEKTLGKVNNPINTRIWYFII